jgi:hypothetical protein
MPSPDLWPHEPRRVAALIGALALGGALIVAVTLIDLLVDVAYRSAAIRLVAALALLVVVARIRASVAASISDAAWDARRPPATAWAPPSFTHTAFEHFHDEIRFSARSQRYFEHVLWPRLTTLARAGAAPVVPLEKPPGRSFGRGPSPAALRALVAALERRR